MIKTIYLTVPKLYFKSKEENLTSYCSKQTTTAGNTFYPEPLSMQNINKYGALKKSAPWFLY